MLDAQRYGSYQFRPGYTGVTITVSSSNPAVATVSPTSLMWGAGTTQLAVTVQPVSTGTAAISFAVPDPYVTPSSVQVQIMGGNLSIGPFGLKLGKGLQDILYISGDNFGRDPVRVTVTSGDPARVLVSSSPTVAGQASVDVVNQPGRQLPVYLQALADNGSVQITVSAMGYNSAQSTVQLSPAEVVLAAPQLETLTPLSAAVGFEARMAAQGSTFYYRGPAPTLRPGAPSVNVQVILSDPTIGAVSPAQLTFNPGDGVEAFSFQPAAAGSALLTLSVPSGFTDPVSLRQQLLTVVPARAAFSSPLTVGNDLIRLNTITLSSAAAQNLSLTLTSADPTRLLLANSSNATGTSSVQVTISAGSSGSTSFYLIGLASSGTVALSLSGAPLTLPGSDVVLEPSGFIFGQVSSSATVNSPLPVQILASALNPQTLAPEGAFALRAGISPVTIVINSSNPSIFGDSSTQFYAGDSQENTTLRPQSTGPASLTLQTPAGFTQPSSGASVAVAVH